MPNYPNVHAFLDNEELHVPKDFSTASNGTSPIKNLNGDYEWANKELCWSCPVISMVDASLPPPTTFDGDRYLLVNVASTAIDSGWDGLALNDVAQYYDVTGTADLWKGLTPQEGTTLYDKSRDGYWFFDGTNWQGRDFTFNVDIASADILTLFDTPVDLIAAPLTGYAIQVESISLEISFNSAAYVLGITNTVLIKNTTGTTQWLFSAASLEAASSGISAATHQGNVASIVEAEKIIVTTNLANPTTGDSDIRISGKYRMVKLI